MQAILYIGFVIFGLVGIDFIFGAKGAIHEGVAAILLLCSVVCLVGAGVIGWLRRIHAALATATRPTAEKVNTEQAGDAPPDDSTIDRRLLAVFGAIAVIVIGTVLVMRGRF
jgi:hypothetical protein